MPWWSRRSRYEGGKALRPNSRLIRDFQSAYAPRYARGFSFAEERDFDRLLEQPFRSRTERELWQDEDLRQALRVPFRPSDEPYQERNIFRNNFQSFKSTNIGAKSQPKLSPAAFGSSLAAADFRLNDPALGGQPSVLTTDRIPDLSDGRTRADNRVAQNLKLLAKAQAADSRQFAPEGKERPARTIYGTVAEDWHHPLTVAPVLRRFKRREVLFAKSKIGRRGRLYRRERKWTR